MRKCCKRGTTGHWLLTSSRAKMGSAGFFLVGLLLVLLRCSPQTHALQSDPSKKLYIVYMGDVRHGDPALVTASHRDILLSALGSYEEADVSLVYSYKHGFSGFAAMLTDSQAKKIAETGGAIHVSPSRTHRVQTTRSWNFLDINLNQPSELLERSRGGEDIIIGIIDTGIWPESRSFRDHESYGPVPSRWKGKCQVGNSTATAFRCTKKIIGARWYTGGVDEEDLKGESMSPRDFNGHGTHTASTAAGALVRNVSFRGISAGDARGGAPRARIAVYKSLWGKDGAGNDATVLAAIDDAIHDGVDVISLSLAALEDTSFGTLHAVASGMTLVFAAGNGGPMPATVSNSAPWVITVAASTIDRAYPTRILLGNNQTFVGQALHRGSKKNFAFRNLTFSTSCDRSSLNASEIEGKVILCATGSTPQASELAGVASHVLDSGGKGLIVAQYALSTLEPSDPCVRIPCVLVDFDAGTQMAAYISTSSSPVVRIRSTVTVVGSQVVSPKVAGFSSRGPSAVVPGIIKPDIAAPGVNILAAMGATYVMGSGTSMATPHVAAIVALLKSIHPDWSPAALKSALMTTASTTITSASADVNNNSTLPITAEGLPRKPADPFDFGSGQVNPTRAADPGLVYDIDPAEYRAFLHCSRGEDLALCTPTRKNMHRLNLPSISVPELTETVTVRRTATNVGETNTIYELEVEAPDGVEVDVSPRELLFYDVIQAREFDVTFRPRRKSVQGDYAFGSLTWKNENHTVRIPIAVRQVVEDSYSDVS